MYELELVNEEVKLNFFKAMAKVIKHKKKPLLPYAIKEYIRSNNPNIPIYIIRPIVSKAIERLKAFSDMRIESFKSEEEAQKLCKKND